jgi:hypothetical protein
MEPMERMDYVERMESKGNMWVQYRLLMKTLIRGWLDFSNRAYITRAIEVCMQHQESWACGGIRDSKDSLLGAREAGRCRKEWKEWSKWKGWRARETGGGIRDSKDSLWGDQGFQGLLARSKGSREMPERMERMEQMERMESKGNRWVQYRLLMKGSTQSSGWTSVIMRTAPGRCMH